MTKPGNRISREKVPIRYSINGPSNAFGWTFTASWPAESLGTICDALNSVAEELFGSNFYSPDVENESTHCRYEWFQPRGRLKFVFRYGIMFTVKSGQPVESITAFVAYGEQHPKFGQLPVFTDSEQAKHIAELMKILRRAEELTDDQTWSTHHIPFYVESAGSAFLEESVVVPSWGLLALPTVRLRREHKLVSCFIVSAAAANLSRARAVSHERLTLITSLLTLAMGQRFSRVHPSFPKKYRPASSLLSIDPVPSNEQFYPAACWSDHGHLGWASDRALVSVLSMFERLTPEMKDLFTNSVWAFAAGKQVLQTHPTLASVAFIAALSAFSTSRRCEGQTVCDKCGPLQSHFAVGDRRALVDFVIGANGFPSGSKTFKQARDVLNRVYSSQRSAYVHSAALQHGETRDNTLAFLSRPSRNRAFNDALAYNNDLASLEGIVRQTLLIKMATEAGVDLITSDFDLSPDRILVTTPFTAELRVPAKNTVVGLSLK